MPYVIGADFGTLSARFLMVDAKTGEELGTVIKGYAHGVMDTSLNGQPLPPDYALQDASDYLDVLKEGIPELMAKTDAGPDDVIAIGIDFTASTILPTDDRLVPLSAMEDLKDNPHAYVKLWKHHAAQKHATEAVRVAKARHESFLARYGDQITSEWLVPKVMEIIKDAPDVHEKARHYIEAGDFIVSRLTGTLARSACQAGYKALWSADDGYPSKDYYRELDPGLEDLVETRLQGEVRPVGSVAGQLTGPMADTLGLKAGIPVSTAYIDAHSAVPALGITRPGTLVMILGTSTCHMVLGHEERLVKGISGVVKDGIVPGLYGYEAGQACVGDGLDWYVRTMMPESVSMEARARNLTPFELLEEKASRLRPGSSGLIALDWLNGNRSILSDSDLSGLIVGLTLGTKPEEIYRALIESTAFGARVIIEEFETQGVAVETLAATGGISKKSPLFMQIYADVTGRTIRIGASDQAVALGSAIAASACAGSKAGGHDSIARASEAMGKLLDDAYVPDPASKATYDRLYAIYRRLHDGFGLQDSDLMHTLKDIKADNTQAKEVSK